MRILHVLGKLDRGGVETWLVQTLRHIDRSRYQFDFLVHNDGPGAYDDEVRSMGSRIIPCLSPSNPFQFARNFLTILREYGPYHCVHSHVHHYSGYVLSLARIARVPSRIGHSHSDTRIAEQQRGVTRQVYLYAMAKMLQASATAGFAVTESAADALFPSDWKADSRWRVLPLGIDLEPFSRSINRCKVRKDLGISHDAFVVGHVGRFSAVKNHSFLVDVAKYVCNAEPKAMFLLVGDGPLRREVEHSVRKCGLERKFVFTGLRDDVPALMQGAMDTFLFPSLLEGFPVVLMEAQAASLPCFITNKISKEVDILPELVHRLSLADGPDVWGDAVLNGRLTPLRSRSLNAMSNFSIDAAVSRLCSIYDDAR